MMKRKAKTNLMPVAIVLGVVVIGAIVLAQNSKRPVSGSGVQVNTDRRSTPAVPLSGGGSKAGAASAGRKALAYYTGGIRGDLFTAPTPPAPKPKTKPPKKVLPPPPPAPAPVNPLADYTYTGTVKVGGALLALVENTKSKEGQYLKQGDPFLGGVITGINERTLTVKIAGADQMLAKSDNFKLTPLDKSAPYMQGGGQPGQPGQPGGQPQPGPPAPGASPPPGAMPVNAKSGPGPGVMKIAPQPTGPNGIMMDQIQKRPK